MPSMDSNETAGTRARGSYRAAAVVIAVTIAMCAIALLFRTPLRSRYWAWQVVNAANIEARTVPLTHLCNAGDGGRWGTTVLLDDSRAEIRQFGLLILQHVHSDWSRERLLQSFDDPSEAVREMAALGLAIQGDESVIPELRRRYVEGDAGAASAACIALGRLATPTAVEALATLAERPADVVRRAAVVDALGQIGRADCVIPLVTLLDDHRPCEVPTPERQVLDKFGPLAASAGLVLPGDELANAEGTVTTIAERAAAALARITGLEPPFASDLEEQERAAAAEAWRAWAASHATTP